MTEAATTATSYEWLRRAFDFLIDNAVEATQGQQERKIVITTLAEDGEARSRISDNGPGIPESIRQKLFLEPIPKPKGAKGLGMGLLLAQIIAENYGGNVRIERTDPTGTTMVMSLPVEQ